MNRCDTCGFWKQHEEYEDIGFCTIPADVAKAWDYDGSRKHLETKHDYGCVQWKAKEVPADEALQAQSADGRI